jgi:hypothetical protein
MRKQQDPQSMRRLVHIFALGNSHSERFGNISSTLECAERTLRILANVCPSGSRHRDCAKIFTGDESALERVQRSDHDKPRNGNFSMIFIDGFPSASPFNASVTFLLGRLAVTVQNIGDDGDDENGDQPGLREHHNQHQHFEFHFLSR